MAVRQGKAGEIPSSRGAPLEGLADGAEFVDVVLNG